MKVRATEMRPTCYACGAEIPGGETDPTVRQLCSRCLADKAIGLPESYPFATGDEIARWLQLWGGRAPEIDPAVLSCAHCAPVLAICLNAIVRRGGHRDDTAWKIMHALNESAPHISHEPPL